MLDNTTLFSIGYGNRKLDVFISLLKQYEITTLADIRTKPFSRFQPYYNKARLEASLHEVGIKYLFMGDWLGGKPKDEKYYTDGKVDYSLINSTQEYQNAITQLITLSNEGERICTMCCELKPTDCHRKGLVGETLYAKGITVHHIDEKGAITVHTTEQADLHLF
jgi:uncharacterized protein (DUF488 family)